MENETLKTTLASILQLIRAHQQELEVLRPQHEALVAVLSANPKFAAEYQKELADQGRDEETDECANPSLALHVIDAAIASIQQLPKLG